MIFQLLPYHDGTKLNESTSTLMKLVAIGQLVVLEEDFDMLIHPVINVLAACAGD